MTATSEQPGAKRCQKCSLTKPLNQFYRNKSKTDGRQGQCKNCDRHQNKAWKQANPEKVAANRKAWYLANRERQAASGKAWRVANPEKVDAYAKAWAQANPEKVAAKNKAWCEANPEKVAANGKAWAQANPEKVAAKNKAWREANPEKIAAKGKRRRARKLNAGVFAITAKELKTLLAQPCYLCHIAPSTDIEHIQPLSLGGRHSIGNILGACKSCNSKKGTKLLSEYRRYNQPIKVTA